MESYFNPWAVDSLDAFVYFHCPECGEMSQFKQDFIDHAFEMHPEGAQSLYNIRDPSIYDVNLPGPELFLKQELDIKPDTDKLGGQDLPGQANVSEDDLMDDLDDLDYDYEAPAKFKKKKNKTQLKTNQTVSKEFNCKECKAGFACKATLQLHEKKEHNKSGLQCPKCDNEAFENIFALNEHMAECLGKTDIEFKCNKCEGENSVVWNSAHALVLHLGLEHDVDKPAVCDLCGLIMSYGKHLQRHKRKVHPESFPEEELLLEKETSKPGPKGDFFVM